MLCVYIYTYTHVYIYRYKHAYTHWHKHMQDILDKAGKGGGPGHYALVKALKTKYKGKSPKTQKRAMPEGKGGKVRVHICSVCVLCVSCVCLVCVWCVSGVCLVCVLCVCCVFKLNA